MTDIEMLRATIERKGVKLRKVCEALEISEPTLRRKMTGKAEFQQGEIVKLRDFLSLTDDEVLRIFLL